MSSHDEYDFDALEAELAPTDLEAARHFSQQLAKCGRIIAALAQENGGSFEVDLNRMLTLPPGVTLKYDVDEDANTLTVYLVES